MKIVIFGNGLIGSQVATALSAQGHDVTALGREAGIDTTTGLGIDEAIVGAEVVVDLTNSPSWSDEDVFNFFHNSSTNLLTAEQRAGVGHHVILSIVGADNLPDSGYLRAKVEQERVVKAGPIPYSIVRSTQFFEFIAGIADNATVDGIVRVTPAHLQPIASADVVANVAQVVTGPPLNDTIEIAGPQPLGIDEMVRQLFAANGDTRTVLPDPAAGYFGAVLTDTDLTPGPNGRVATTNLQDWLARRTVSV